MKKLSIAITGVFQNYISKNSRGGGEAYTYTLARALARRGHRVTVFTSGKAEFNDSRVRAVNVLKKPILYHEINYRKKNSKKTNVDLDIYKNDLSYRIIANYYSFLRVKKKQFDVIHQNAFSFTLGTLTDFIGRAVGIPVVNVYHSVYVRDEIGEKIPGVVELRDLFDNENYVAISDYVRHWNTGLKFTKTIYNGIDTNLYHFNDKPKNYYAWLGRIMPRKGLLDALKIFNKTNDKLIIGAQKDDSAYFKECKQYIDGKRIKYLGPVNLREKTSLLRNAKALIFSSHDEVCPLVPLETMACGTPVVAYENLAVRPLIKHGKTGFLYRKEAEAKKYLEQVGAIKRQDCRDHVQKNFSDDKMAGEYEKLYYRLVRSNKKSKKIAL